MVASASGVSPRPAFLDRLAEHLDDRVSGPWVEKCFGPGASVSLLDALIRANLRIRNRRGDLVWFTPNQVQSRFAQQRSRRNTILKARQMGITTYLAARFFLKTILRPGTLTLQVAHSLESAQQMFRIVHRFLARLHPDAEAAVVTSRANVRELSFGAIDSRYILDTAGNPNAGRGLTIHNLHVSEFALWPGHPQETLAALLAAVPPQGEVEIESTPHGVGDFFHSVWSSACSAPTPRGGYTPHFFPWWLEPTYQLPVGRGDSLEPLTAEERSLIEREHLTLEQIQFRRHLRATFGDLAPQEFAESDTECFLSTGRPVFDVHAIDARLRPGNLPEPIRVAQNGAEVVWFDPLPGRSYIIGADVAEGGAEGDFSAAVVIDTDLGLQCAEILARWPIHRFAQELSRLGHRYNSALIAVERNNQGHAVLYALEQQHGYGNLYRHPVSAANGSPSRSLRTGTKKGWPMNVQTKPEAINRLAGFLREEPKLFPSRRLLEQCRSYVYLHGGETGALPGRHDDLVIAVAIALAARARGADVQLQALSI